LGRPAHTFGRMFSQPLATLASSPALLTTQEIRLSRWGPVLMPLST